MDHFLNNSPLGKTTHYCDTYNASLLHPIPRSMNRRSFHLETTSIFQGIDLWNSYEFSWIDSNTQLPMAKHLQLIFSCHSPNLLESKSLKLYLYSFANTSLTEQRLLETLKVDLSQASGAPVTVLLLDKSDPSLLQLNKTLTGTSIDSHTMVQRLDKPTPTILRTEPQALVTETLSSDLLQSICPVTGHPDWASIAITYHGPKLDPSHLLTYLCAYQRHPEFHEHCVERIFCDVLLYCKPKQLTLQACVTRRGGLDINPIRSTQPIEPDAANWHRLFRG